MTFSDPSTTSRISETPKTAPPRGFGAWWAIVLGAVFAVLGVVLGVGGVWLIAVGGSFYYLLAGLGLVASGVLLIRRQTLGVWIYAAVWLFTLFWALWEVGPNGWPLVPRLVAPTILLVLALVTLPALRGGGRYGRSGAVMATLAALIISGGALVFNDGVSDAALAQAAAPSSPAEASQDSAAQIIPEPASVMRAPASAMAPGEDWPVYGGSELARRYSPLDQITADNVANLEKVWTYRTGDMPSVAAKGKYSPETTPLKVGDHIYLCSAKNIMMSLNPRTGEEEWRYDPQVSDDAIPYGATCRGVAYYEAPSAPPDSLCATRIIEGTLDARLIAVDADTGQLCSGFGRGGMVDLNQGIGETVPGWYSVTAPPTIVRGVAVVGAQISDGQAEDAPSGVVRGYDAATGEFLWAWDMGHPGRTGQPPEGEVYSRGTPNMWTMAAADPVLGYVYLPLGNSSVDYYGGNRKPFENEYNSSLVAIDVTTGKPVWNFQTVHYDLWDYDLGSQPSLVDLPTDKGKVPAIILPSKQGQIYVLNRETGESLFPVEERAVPSGGVEPENLSPTQPYSGYAHLDQPVLTERDMWGMSPLDQLWCRIQFNRAAYDGEYTPPTADRHFIEYPGYNGGSDWGSVAVDADRGVMIANYNDMPNFNRLIPREKADEMGIKSIAEGGNRASAEGAGDAQAGSPYAINVNAGWRMPTGLLCAQPPYGRIRAIDLKTGNTLWDRPLGSAVKNGPFGIPSMLPIDIGTPNNGGPLVTAGGLIFVAATTDDRFRAINMETGETVWQVKLPAGGQTTPITYEADGRQYVAIAPGGHHFMETPIGDYVIAYALPETQGQPGR